MSGLKKAGIFLSFTLLLSNILGFIRNIALAKFVTPFENLDAYFAAFRWPDFIFNILILGAITTVFVPIYTDIRSKKGKEEANTFTNTLIFTVGTALVAALAVLYLFMPYLTLGLVPGASEHIKSLTFSLSRIMIFSPLLFGFSYIIGALLQANKRFFYYSIAPLVYNLAIIVGALGYSVWGIYGLAWSVVLGALLHLLIQLPGLKGIYFKLKPKINFKDAEIAKTIKLALPRTVGIGSAQILLLAFTSIASTIGAKSIAIYNLTNDFATTPTVIVANSLATILFPSLAASHAKGDTVRFNTIVTKALRLSIFLLIPSSIAMWLLRAQLTRLYLALGKSLGWSDTIRAINTLGILVIGIIFAGLVSVLARVKYAQHDTKRPMYFAIISVVFSIILAVILARVFAHTYWNVAALALAFILGQALNAGLLLFDVRGTILPKPAEKEILTVLIPKTIIASVAMGAAIWLSLRLGILFLDTDRVVGLFGQTVLASIIGGGVFYTAARLLNTVELLWLTEKQAADVAIPK